MNEKTPQERWEELHKKFLSPEEMTDDELREFNHLHEELGIDFP